MDYLTVKALHIIFVVTWFAGLFYIVRLFIYDREAQDKEEPEKTILTKQFRLMERRLLFGITWPSMILTILFGTWLLIKNPALLEMPFMHVKLGFVALLIIYHLSCQMIYSRFKKGSYKYSSTGLRIWNELATIFLVAIVFVIVLKNTIDWIYGTVAILGLGFALYFAIRWYKRVRGMSGTDE